MDGMFIPVPFGEKFYIKYILETPSSCKVLGKDRIIGWLIKPSLEMRRDAGLPCIIGGDGEIVAANKRYLEVSRITHGATEYILDDGSLRDGSD